MRFRAVLVGIAALAGLAGVAWLAGPGLARVKAPIRVGLLHSRSGPMAISELSMLDAERLAIEELNEQGGLLGRRIEAVEADGQSDPREFGRAAERLISVEKVNVIVGCWSSSCRKSVRPVVEKANHLLIFPVAYEGLEQSPQIVYTGATANQQVIPTVKWCMDVLKAKSFYLVGTDALGPRSINTIIKDQLKALGAEIAGEEYVGLGAGEIDRVVDKAVKAAPSIILGTLEGDVNPTFYKSLRSRAGSKIPTLSFSVTEDELRELPVKLMVEDYAACNYFQSIERPENLEFVRKFKKRYGDTRVAGDAVATAYNSIQLWAQAVREAETDDVVEVRDVLLRQSLNAPEGIISIDRETQHTWRPFFVGRVRSDGQFAIVESVLKPIKPVPFPSSRTRDEWETLIGTLLTTAARN